MNKIVGTMFGQANSTSHSFTTPERQSPGLLEDFAVRKVLNTQEGTIEKVPTNSNDIVNKAYADSIIGGGLPSQTGHSGEFLTTDGTDASWAEVSGGAVDSVNSKTGVVVLDADDIDDTSTTNKFITSDELTKLSGIEPGAEVNNISDTNATDLTDGNGTTLHTHSYTNLTDKPTIPTMPSNTDSLTEGTTNLYYTDARAVSAVSTADDYLKNDASDTTTGTLTAANFVVTSDNSSADTPYVPMVLYNTDDTPPTASTYPIGTLYIKYTE